MYKYCFALALTTLVVGITPAMADSSGTTARLATSEGLGHGIEASVSAALKAAGLSDKEVKVTALHLAPVGTTAALRSFGGSDEARISYLAGGHLQEIRVRSRVEGHAQPLSLHSRKEMLIAKIVDSVR